MFNRWHMDCVISGRFESAPHATLIRIEDGSSLPPRSAHGWRRPVERTTLSEIVCAALPSDLRQVGT